MRIYSNYEETEFEKVKQAAEGAGMTPSAYCKSAVMEKVLGESETSLPAILNILQVKLEGLHSGTTFIVSDLVPNAVWSSLNRSEKNTVSKQLAKAVRENPSQFAINQTVSGKTTQYIKL